MIKIIIKSIHSLRVLFLIIIVVGFFYVLGLNPITVSRLVGSRISSAIGFNVSVPENPVNKIAAQLKEKENRLEVQENNLLKREKEVAEAKVEQQKKIILFMSIGIGILFILVTLNYYLDFRRRKLSN